MTDSVPMFVWPVIGFRVWKLSSDGTLWPRAVSAMERLKAEPWRSGRNDARCMYVGFTREPHAAPDQHCDCGLHAHHEIGQVRQTSRAEDLVVGGIVAWGAIQVHRTGFRAEHAQVVALARSDSAQLTAPTQAAAERYGVPVLAYEDLDAYGQTRGARLPAAIAPARWPHLRRGTKGSSSSAADARSVRR